MTRLLTVLICALLPVQTAALELALPSPTSQSRAADRLCTLALELGQDVARLTGYPAPQTCPDIDFGLFSDTVAFADQAAAYDPEQDLILLAADLDLSQAVDQSFLFHELVHQAQYRSGQAKRAACPASLEAEAYFAQAVWLGERGLVGQRGEFMLFATVLGVCEDTYP